MRILSEADVFRVIALSSRSEVREFERWLVELVLPAMYGADQRGRPSPESDVHRLRRELLLELVAEDLSSQARRRLYQQLEQVSADLERDRSARPESHPADSLGQLRQQFWGALVPNDLASLNHAHQPNLLAINLPETLATVRSAGFPCIHVNVIRRALRSDPDFVRVAAIYSESYRRTIKCWMFHARDRGSTQGAATP